MRTSLARRRSRWNRVYAVAAIIALASSAATGMWVTPSEVPVSRVLRNVGKHLEEHPNNAEDHYLIGRIHGLAFSMKSRVVEVYGRRDGDGIPHLASDDFQFGAQRWMQANPDQALNHDELLKHLTESIRNFDKALSIADEGRTHLGIAYILETGAAWAGELDVLPAAERITEAESKEVDGLIQKLSKESESDRKKGAEGLRQHLNAAAPKLFELRNHQNEGVRTAARSLLTEYWRERALSHYLAAFDEAFKKDSAIKEQPMRGLRTLASFEAGGAFARLMAVRGARNKAERASLDRVQAGLKLLKAKPENRAITPIILSLDRPRSLNEMLDPSRTVQFDLDGTGRRSWPWIGPETGFLVWDPQNTGKITSGLQMFGSVSWWMFFSDGYRAMDCLDDDRDGWLRGRELVGLSVWFDRNSNGASEPGEVVPIRRCGIDAISVSMLSSEGASPMNPFGLRMDNGRILPTYDWVASPIEPPAASPSPVPSPSR